MTAMRLDVALTGRGLARSRSRARELIDRGAVSVNGVTSTRASAPVTDVDEVIVESDDWVSRAAPKLERALDERDVRVAGRSALDIGACTGGFTQVLLSRGARRVIALDVGHGQMAPEIAADPRVVNLEGVNAREMDPAVVGETVDLVVSDVSFISLTYVVPRIPAVIAEDADVLLLVKPQFEVGRARLGRGGVVTDPSLRAEAVGTVVTAAREVGLGLVGVTRAAVRGQHGNQEFVVHLRAEPAGVSAVDLPAPTAPFWADEEASA